MAKTPSSTGLRQTKGSTKAKPAQGSSSFADGDLGKIQSILFGERSEEFENQLTEMAAKFERLISQTNSEFTARINALEADHQRRLDALNRDLTERTTALHASKLDSKEAGQILAAAAEKISKS